LNVVAAELVPIAVSAMFFTEADENRMISCDNSIVINAPVGERLTVRRMARDLDSSLLNIKEALESRN
jgi:hypothetical protein